MSVATGSHRLPGFSHLFAVHLRPELKELYLFSLLYAFAYAMIVIFEPIFFYKVGFSLSFIALYYALHYSLYAVLMPLGGKFAARFGLERSLSMSLPLFIVYFLTLANIPRWPDLVWLAIVLLTVQKIFYWPAFHAHMAKFGDARNRGTEISWMIVMRFGVGIMGPLLGGVIAARFGFPVLFVVAAGLVLSASIPLLRTKERYRPVSFPYFAPWRIVFSRRHRHMSLAMLGMGEDLIDMVYWPIFLFIVLGSTVKIGLLSALTLAVMALTSFFVGEMSDRMPRRRVLRIFLPFMMIGYLFRPLAGGPLLAVLTDTLNRMAAAGVGVPMVYRLYVRAQQAGALRYMLAFELVLAVTKAVVAFGLVWVFAAFLPYTGFTIVFVASAVMAIMYLFL